MKRALTAEQMRAVDAASVVHGVSSTALMETAGAALTAAALRLASDTGRFFVVCGPGNNGGDGLVVARRLAARGRLVWLELLGAPSALSGDPALNFQKLAGTTVVVGALSRTHELGPGDVVVDAIFGTGIGRAPTGVFAEAIERITHWRSRGASVVAADLPSGLSSDTGQALGACVAADVTVALGFLKVGQVVEPGATLCGRLEVADIGIPTAAEAALAGPLAYLLEEGDVRTLLPPRRSDTHKGTYGHVLVVAGGPGTSGAAALAGLGALRGGAGLVTVAARAESLGEALRHAPELMGRALPGSGPLGLADLDALLAALEGKQALVIGPGIPRGPETGRLLGALLTRSAVPAVLDADALNAVAEDLSVLSGRKGGVVLTPHPGEMARLIGHGTAEVQSRRHAVTRELAMRLRVVTVLKGARTVIGAPSGSLYVNPTGNPGMATAGSGDVLAGLLGALVAQGLSCEDAALVGVYAHGLAGDLMVLDRGQLGLIASDLVAGLGRAWVALGR